MTGVRANLPVPGLGDRQVEFGVTVVVDVTMQVELGNVSHRRCVQRVEQSRAARAKWTPAPFRLCATIIKSEIGIGTGELCQPGSLAPRSNHIFVQRLH